jgi:hypothetical protein
MTTDYGIMGKCHFPDVIFDAQCFGCVLCTFFSCVVDRLTEILL